MKQNQNRMQKREALKQRNQAAVQRKPQTGPLKAGDKDWNTPCDCGQVPTVHPTGLCGPCCFGEAETYGGNW